jgi:hypothetical protein
VRIHQTAQTAPCPNGHRHSVDRKIPPVQIPQNIAVVQFDQVDEIFRVLTVDNPIADLAGLFLETDQGGSVPARQPPGNIRRISAGQIKIIGVSF